MRLVLLERMKDEQLKTILILRYINGLDWEDVARGVGYCRSQTFHLHRDALKAFATILRNTPQQGNPTGLWGQTDGLAPFVYPDTAIIQEARSMVNMAEVCEENRGLIYAVAKRYYAACTRDRAVDLEDLAQAGYIGLIEAARTYDETKGMFSTWAAVCIRNEIRAALGLRNPRPERGALSLDAEIGEDITLADTLEAPEDIEGDADHAELVRVMRETVAALPVPQNELVRLHDLRGRNLSAAGRACGLTAAAANSAYVQARENLYRNASLRALAEAHGLDLRTKWHRHVGVREYRSTWTSSTEALVFWREKERRKTERFTARAGGAAVGAADTGRKSYPRKHGASAGPSRAKKRAS